MLAALINITVVIIMMMTVITLSSSRSLSHYDYCSIIPAYLHLREKPQDMSLVEALLRQNSLRQILEGPLSKGALCICN